MEVEETEVAAMEVAMEVARVAGPLVAGMEVEETEVAARGVGEMEEGETEVVVRVGVVRAVVRVVAARAAVRVEAVRAAVRAAEAMVVVVVVEVRAVAAREGAARVVAGFVVRSPRSRYRRHSKPRGSLTTSSQGPPGQLQPRLRTAHRLPG